MKSSKGRLDKEIPVPNFLVDLFHRVKAVAKHIFYIVKDFKAQIFGCNKADSIILNKYWGYMIRRIETKF